MRQMMFLVVANAIQMESEWAKWYECLVPIKCGYDERTRSYKGKVRVFGRIAGQMIEMIYAFLKKDAEVLSKVPPGVEPPEPTLYDPEVHKRHREGQYCSLKPGTQPSKIIQLQSSHDPTCRSLPTEDIPLVFLKPAHKRYFSFQSNNLEGS